MLRQIGWLSAAGLLLLFPPMARAGGPPWICLPIDGVTVQNSQACAELLTTRLADKRWPYAGRPAGVQLHPYQGQWYLTMSMGKDIALGEVEAALKGTGYWLPRDKFRLFGHVVLEIRASSSAIPALLNDLEAMPLVSVAESKAGQEAVQVTVDMPYPSPFASADVVSWDRFWRNDLSSDPATKSEPAATADELPSYAAFAEVALRHGASLHEVRWSSRHACRPMPT
jgi:hypothetical protein